MPNFLGNYIILNFLIIRLSISFLSFSPQHLTFNSLSMLFSYFRLISPVLLKFDFFPRRCSIGKKVGEALRASPTFVHLLITRIVFPKSVRLRQPPSLAAPVSTRLRTEYSVVVVIEYPCQAQRQCSVISFITRRQVTAFTVEDDAGE